MSDFLYSSDNKRYHTLSYHLKNTFGEKVYKAVIDGGFSCPNKDGTVSFGGCAFCLSGSGAFTSGGISVTEQIKKEQERIERKIGKTPKMIAYFQANTNTYAPAKVLRKKFYEAAECENVVGLSVATRPDCIGEDVLELLSEINKKTYLTVELGVQTVNDKSACLFNRGYRTEVFYDAVSRLKKEGIRVLAHIITGLYKETYEDFITTARELGKLKIDAVKISLLHVLKGTEYERLYNEGKYVPLSKEEYIKAVAEQISFFPPECVIERVTGDGDKKSLIAPMWSRDKISVLGGIDKYMAENGLYQGMNYRE